MKAEIQKLIEQQAGQLQIIKDLKNSLEYSDEGITQRSFLFIAEVQIETTSAMLEQLIHLMNEQEKEHSILTKDARQTEGGRL